MLMIEIIAVFHILLMLLNSFYAFLFKKSWVDYLYLLLVYLIVLHWTFLNGECIITYVFKKLENKHYIAGSHVTDSEVKRFLNVSDTNMNNLMTLHVLLVQVNIILVVLRNKIPIHLYFIYFALTILNYVGCKWFKSNLEKKYLLFQEVMKYTLIAYGIYTLWVLRKRFK